MSQITTITFFRFQDLQHKTWAMSQMYYAHAHLRTAGASFYKLMGSGRKDGFHLLPDLSVWCLLQVWEKEQDAEIFFSGSGLIKEYERRVSEKWTLYLKCLSVKGFWEGRTPFLVNTGTDPGNPKIAAMTRASIRPGKLFSFWRFVPHSHPEIKNVKGLIFSKGIGERPLAQMATFSLWRSVEDLKAFAYGSEEHKLAMKKKQQLKWYSEELFARFQPYRSTGSWNSEDPLCG